MCINITIWHTGSGNTSVIGFTSSVFNGNYASGSQAFGWGGYGTPTDEEYKESVAIPNTMLYFNVPKTEICGYECIPNWTGESWSTCLDGKQSRIETDGCENTRTSVQNCTPTSNTTLIVGVGVAVMIGYLMMKKK